MSRREGPWGQGTLALRITWLATLASARVSRRLAGPLAGRLWFTPWRVPRSRAALEREAEWLTDTEPFSVEVAGRRLTGFAAGDGPPVLLVHGWADRASTMGAFVAPLVQAGFRVIGVDQPAHGGSPGRQTNLYETPAMVAAVAAQVGGLHGIVAHSMGGATTALALRDGVPVERVALLAPPANLEEAMGPFLEMFHLPPGVLGPLRERIERRFGPDVWQNVAVEAVAPQLDVPALIVHDRDDPQVPFEQAVRITQAWTGARLVATDGLGHQRLLRDAGVIQDVVAFLGDADRSDDLRVVSEETFSRPGA